MKAKHNDDRYGEGQVDRGENANTKIPGRTAIVVTGEPGERSLLARLLEKAGLEVQAFAEPESALGWMRLREPPRLVVTDLYMPGIDGWRFCRLLRSPECPLFNRTQIVVVSSTFSGESVQAITTALGADAFVSGPYDAGDFERVVHAMLRGERWEAQTRVLVVEDNPAQVSCLKHAMTRHGWRMASAKTGAAGRELLASFDPDYVLLDYHLPDMPGDALLNELAAAKRRAHVIMITGDLDPDLGVRFFRRGAAACLRKPFPASGIISLCEQVGREQAVLRIQQRLDERNQELKQSESQYRALFASMVSGFALFEAANDDRGLAADYRCVEANPMCERLTGFPRERLVGRGLNELITEGFHPLSALFAETEATGKPVAYERFLPKTKRHFEGSAFCPNPGRFAIAFNDVTGRKQAETAYLRAQRMECIGSLASGLAHDLNNVLAPILMAVPMLRQNPPQADTESLLNTISASASRGAAMVKQLLAFGRGTDGDRLEVQPRELLREIVRLIQDTFPKNIEVTSDCAADLWTLKANNTQIHQVLLNLCINARDAMPDGGTLAIQAANAHLDTAFTAQHPGLEPGSYVAIHIRDSGTGIPPEIVDKIFDPYFTTKEPGRGTGLGLPTVLSIVERHHGCLCLETQLGQGTQFTVYLPALNLGTTLGRERPPSSGGGQIESKPLT